MNPIYPDITLELIGNDGNAFAILANAKRQMQRNDEAKHRVDEFMTEAMSGDYDHLLQTCIKWFTVL